MNVICIGGGAASFFFACEASSLYPHVKITILEQGKNVLGKVLVSGGGRCNVTHNCTEPEELIKHYPRGGRELLGPFHRFGPQNTIDWFAQHGVKLKTESDGRMFPQSNSSQTILDCFKGICKKNGVIVQTQTKVKNIRPVNGGEGGYIVETLNDDTIQADKIFIAPGSSKGIWQVLEHLGHTIVPPVPSLFTFQIKDPRIENLSGVSLANVQIKTKTGGLTSEGPLLITHKGISGPAVLKMSAIGARLFNEADYKFEISIDFRPDIEVADIKHWRNSEAKKLVGNHHISDLPKRLFQSLLSHAKIDPQKKFASLSKKEMELLIVLLKKTSFQVIGQNTFKEEFVTAGGVDLAEVDFKRFSSRLIPNMHFAGEILNIDAVTGGFNFQAAWTGAFIAAQGMEES